MELEAVSSMILASRSRTVLFSRPILQDIISILNDTAKASVLVLLATKRGDT